MRKASTGVSAYRSTDEIERLDYRPGEPYELHLEIFSVSSLRRRVGEALLRSHRYAFHQVVFITHGHCTQMVDFRPIRCAEGSVVALKPGQAHRFGADADWNGWLLLFREEFLWPAASNVPELKLAVALDGLVEHLTLPGPDFRIVVGSIDQMRKDVDLDAPRDEVHALLRCQLSALLLRLSILGGRQTPGIGASGPVLERYRDFQQLVERKFATWHQVADYARHLGCSARSLGRATAEVGGLTAKAFIAARIGLEAKRLLVHTTTSVTAIGYSLGFDEATNFVKFFRREAGCTPAEFRKRNAS